jgi:cystine transport system permease protein
MIQQSLIWQSLPLLLQGMLYTIGLSAGSMALGLVLGFAIALARLSGRYALVYPARFYVSLIRGTPLLVQLFIIYYGLPDFDIILSPIAAALIGFSVNLGAYTSEILRGSIASVDHGQWEAAAVIGMNWPQTMRRVILPQAARTALPPLSNSFISLIKDTSLAATIQVPDLFREAQLISARTFKIFDMYLTSAALYWILSMILSTYQNRLESRVNRHLAR